MAEMTLWCGVYGEGSIFPVEIARSATVHELRRAICREKRFEEKYTLVASDLVLYVARQHDGPWLQADDDLDAWLRESKIEKKYKKMNPTNALGGYFNAAFQPAPQEIHILVELPAAAAPGGASNSQPRNEWVDAVMSKVEAAVSKAIVENAERQSVHSLSDLNSSLGERIKRKMGLRERWLTVCEPENSSIPGYQWIRHVAESEDSQRTKYMAYLRVHLKTLLDRKDFQLVDVAHQKSLLTVKDPRLPFQLNGTADVLLVNRYKEEFPNSLAGVRMVIELKEQVDSSNVHQAFGQLLSCSLKAPEDCYPMGLLTDLKSTWIFAWFNEESVLTYLTLEYPKNAIDFIVAAVTVDEGQTPYKVPFVDGRPPLKKLKVNDFLPMPSDAADEMMERYELMADVLEPEFLMARRVEYAQHLMQSMPAYAHMHT